MTNDSLATSPIDGRRSVTILSRVRPQGRSTPKRVVHLAYSGLGGQATDVLNLIESDANREFAHSVLFLGREDIYPDYASRCDDLDVPTRYVTKRGVGALKFANRVGAELYSMEPDVVMANGALNVVPCIFARRRGARFKLVVRETQANHLKNVKQHLAAGLAAAYADIFICLTEEYKEQLEGMYSKLLMRHGVVIPNSINGSDYSEGRRYDDAAYKIGMVSRLVSIKDYDTLVDAVALLVHERGMHQLELHIAGDGPTRDAIVERAASQRVSANVVMCGPLDYKAVAELMRSLHIYAHITFGETASNSIMQAMASGLPIIATDVPGVNNMISQNETGLLVPLGEARALADSLATLILQPALRARLGQSAQQVATRRYAPEAVFRQYKSLWRPS